MEEVELLGCVPKITQFCDEVDEYHFTTTPDASTPKLDVVSNFISSLFSTRRTFESLFDFMSSPKINAHLVS